MSGSESGSLDSQSFSDNESESEAESEPAPPYTATHTGAFRRPMNAAPVGERPVFEARKGIAALRVEARREIQALIELLLANDIQLLLTHRPDGAASVNLKLATIASLVKAVTVLEHSEGRG
ncbi:hypothetical protein ACCO45_008560 [Purpureocillium lilacinum]|uniref:Uncharacterized protein n=1 Tax=Purpureocillium lilacinum TaxID=33203 RepID=A0ACC4DNN2_PURLI